MTGTSGSVGEDELMAYIDSRLSPERGESVRAYLAMHPEVRERLSQYAEHRQALRAAFGTQVVEPIPARLRVARLLAERRSRRYRWFTQITAAIFLIVLGGMGGWMARDIVPLLVSPAPEAVDRMIVAGAIAAHRSFAIEIHHPVEVGADQEAHLVQWLSK